MATTNLEQALQSMEVHLGPRDRWPASHGGLHSDADVLPDDAAHLATDRADAAALGSLDAAKFQGDR
jgi:hypothetical protein